MASFAGGASPAHPKHLIDLCTLKTHYSAFIRGIRVIPRSFPAGP
jgi:hypothetical protein